MITDKMLHTFLSYFHTIDNNICINDLLSKDSCKVHQPNQFTFMLKLLAARKLESTNLLLEGLIRSCIKILKDGLIYHCLLSYST